MKIAVFDVTSNLDQMTLDLLDPDALVVLNKNDTLYPDLDPSLASSPSPSAQFQTPLQKHTNTSLSPSVQPQTLLQQPKVPQHIEERLKKFNKVILVSCKTGSGIAELLQAIEDYLKNLYVHYRYTLLPGKFGKWTAVRFDFFSIISYIRFFPYC